MKYKFFKEGISPLEFNKIKMSDINDVLDINNAMELKMKAEEKVRNLIGRMK